MKTLNQEVVRQITATGIALAGAALPADDRLVECSARPGQQWQRYCRCRGAADSDSGGQIDSPLPLCRVSAGVGLGRQLKSLKSGQF